MFKMFRTIASLIIAAVAFTSSASAGTPALQPLPKLDFNPARVTVSGVSSGGFMAVQLHVAHSSLFKGAGSVAGGIWECAKGNATRAQSVCMSSPSQENPSEHISLARDRAAKGEIDDLGNLATSRVVIFASSQDLVIKPESSDKLTEFYQAFLPQVSIVQFRSNAAAHGLPTLAYGNPCGIMGLPWLLNCGDDVAGKILAALESSGTTLLKAGVADGQSILYFDQSKFAGTAANMYPWAAVYIPKKCFNAGTKCGLHVALHGCQMNPDFISSKFIEHAGFNEWAETNDLVVLYPQAAKSAGNPNACWDWTGLTGLDYTSKNGKQIQAIRSIISALGL